MLLKVAICEDDPTQAKNLRRMVLGWSEDRGLKPQVFTYINCEAFTSDWMERMDFDLVFLDIDLGGGINGMELARRIRRKDKRVQILFITGLIEYMGEGYDVQALHFLVKPVDEKRLSAVLDKAVMALERREEFLLLETETEAERIPVSRIVYAEAFSHITALYLAPESKMEAMGCKEIKMCLGDLAELLREAEFFRCHRSYLVHLPYIRKIDKTLAHLDYKASIPVSRGKRNELYQAFLEYYRRQGQV